MKETVEQRVNTVVASHVTLRG